MEKPVQIIKSNLTAGRLLGFAVAGVAVFAILDLLGVTDYLLYPVSKAKQAYAKTKGA